MTNPGFSTASPVIDELIAGEFPRAMDDVTLKTGENRTRGAALGKLTKDTVGAVTADGGNTGNGAPGAATLGADAEVGTYTLTCVEAAANAGRSRACRSSGRSRTD